MPKLFSMHSRPNTFSLRTSTSLAYSLFSSQDSFNNFFNSSIFSLSPPSFVSQAPPLSFEIGTDTTTRSGLEPRSHLVGIYEAEVNVFPRCDNGGIYFYCSYNIFPFHFKVFHFIYEKNLIFYTTWVFFSSKLFS